MAEHAADEALVVVLATRNPGKRDELVHLLRPAPVRLRLPAEVGLSLPDVIEDGTTCLDNAVKKACALAARSANWALADDSGLEVDALGGAPGVRSARYAGEAASDEDNRRRLLESLESASDRRATFRCILALARSGRPVITAEGTLEGAIAPAPRGTGGFGYDSLFVPRGERRTLAELPFEDKQRLSHRARAAERLVALLAAGAMR